MSVESNYFKCQISRLSSIAVHVIYVLWQRVSIVAPLYTSDAVG